MKKRFTFLLCLLTLFSLTACAQKEEKMQLKNQEFYIEYGETFVGDDLSLYLNNTEGFIKDVEMESNIVNISDDTSYPAIGEYEVIFTYKDQMEKMKVIVQDTMAPQFVDLKEQYEVAYNTKIKTEFFKVEDLSKTTITIDDTNVNYKKAGDYQATVSAKDESGNETKQMFKIVVKDEDKPITSAEKTTRTTTETNKTSQSTSPSSAQTSETTQKPTSQQSATQPSKPTETDKPKEMIVDLNVPHHNQYAAGAPMGCEAASLLQALQYKGYAKEYTFSSFLKEMPYANDNNPFHGYAGSPYENYTEGIYQSIFPEPLANWGKQYGSVSDFSGQSAESVIEQVKNGNPVVVFVVYKYGKPKWVDWTFTTGTYRLVDNAHVMTVSGYNPETKQVKVTDPANTAIGQSASYWVSWSDFKRCYEYMKFAVVVK